MVGCNGKYNARNVTHPSIIPTLGGLTLEFPRHPGDSLGFKPPILLEIYTERSIL
jgi:hypothetical protein